ncbi:MAG: helix-turn-helix domain-containing protein [Desulfovibrio sp.]|nr:helix-turn-helix domain-containing protein [Desulfovibrio sp.]
MQIQQAFKYQLKPSAAKAAAMRRFSGCCRYLGIQGR